MPARTAALRFGLYQSIREYAASQPGRTRRQAPLARARLRAWADGDWARSLAGDARPLEALRAELPNLLAGDGQRRSADRGAGRRDRPCLARIAPRRSKTWSWPRSRLASLARAGERSRQCQDAVLRATRQHACSGRCCSSAGQSEQAAWQHAEAGRGNATGSSLPQHAGPRPAFALARVRWRKPPSKPKAVLPLARRRRGARRTCIGRARSCSAGLCSRCAPSWRTATSATYVTSPKRLHAQALAVWERLGNQHAIHSGRYSLAVCAQNAGRNEAGAASGSTAILSRAHATAAGLAPREPGAERQRQRPDSGLRCAGREAVASLSASASRTGLGDASASHELAHGLWNLPRALAHLRAAGGGVAPGGVRGPVLGARASAS
jgi:hypothetical protein